MRIAALQFAGFRGALGEVAIEFPRGFAVIVGRNGTGKSTICDAIEFALTGTIRGAGEHKEKGEGLHDYIWWRGDGTPRARFVNVVLERDDGERYTVTRTPSNDDVTGGVSIESLLCNRASQVELPLTQLCRTAILRDEDITRLSVDLKETERFDFVRSILGTGDFAGAENRAKNVLDLIKNERDLAQRQYSIAANKTSLTTARLSQARTDLADTDDVSSAESFLRELLASPPSNPDELAVECESVLSDARLQADGLVRLYTKFEDFERRSLQIKTIEFEKEKKQLRTKLESQITIADSAETEWRSLFDQLQILQIQNPVNVSLAQLSEHGSRVGLIDGNCPLCGTAQSEEHYRSHVALLTQKIREADATLSVTARALTEAETQRTASRAEAQRLAAQLKQLVEREGELIAEEPAIAKQAELLGIGASGHKLPTLTVITQTIEQVRDRVSRIERALSILHASRAAAQVAAATQELQGVRHEMALAERRLSRVSAAHDRAKEAFDTIRRAKGEFVDDQLAQLEPLLVELYQRLRPHIDWPEVRYRLRGDVRRMLSFEVGDGINPSFIFSSGQRRAAGLAFLLALHLSRNWCTLRSLILDDPVQHIDDYRALHLTEVLASIRRNDRQIICTIEDEALAMLLARRLRTDATSGGLVVRMAYSSQIGIHAESQELIAPMPRSVLLPA